MWLGLCLVAALSPGRARTEGKRGERARASAQAQLEAARLLAAGRDALKAGDTATAERLLTEAYVRVPSPLPFYHLGLLWAQRGQTLLSHDLLRRFDADPAAEPDEAILPNDTLVVLGALHASAAVKTALGDRIH